MKDFVDRLLADPAVIQAFATVAGAIITALLGYITALIHRYIKSEHVAAVVNDAVIHGVQSVYESYVQNIKETATDGKLSQGDRLAAVEMARKRAIEFAQAKGVDLARMMTDEMINAAVSSTVQAIKNGTAKLSGGESTPKAQ